MGGRPRLQVGTYGKIRYRALPDGRVQARVLYRDVDGQSRTVARIAATRTAAERALKAALRDRENAAGDGLVHSQMLLTDLADYWLTRVDVSDRAVNTKQQYRKLVDAYLRPRIGQLRVAEAGVPACDRTLAAIATDHGPAVGKSCRSVLSGMMGLAARHGAITANPVRDTEPIHGASRPKKGRPRALTVAEAEDLSDRLRTLHRAVDLDMPDLVDFMLGTGARIGEALAARDGPNGDGALLLDLDAGTWEVNATVVRVNGAGLIVQERTKSQAGWRVVALPPHLVEMLRGRRAQYRIRGPGGVVFGSPTRRSLRDPSNAARDLKECLALLGYDWPTFHTFRKTVATRMEQAGCTPREVADQLGHSKPSMTADVYFGRSVASTKAASILAR